ncbi:MAG: division/cell wall cluster transcriptional repressor MraZ, partial [Pseudomonadales bacterium]|nr:division/cell wall cluster transcriptional repressor MraZ [Pseudomonadales bacterium]
ALPTRYRELVQNHCEGQMVVTIDTEEQCLLLYPLAEWELIEKKIEALPSFNRAARRIQRLLIGHATDLEIDGNGRILLPAKLREYAVLEKKLVLIGQGKKFEIWSEDKWEEKRVIWLKEEAEGNDQLPDELQSLSL